MAHSTAATHARHASERASAITRARAWYEGGSGFLDATFLQCLSATPGRSDVLVLCNAPSPTESAARSLWVGWADAERPVEATELPTLGSGVAALDRAAGHAAIVWEAVTADAPELRFVSLRCD